MLSSLEETSAVYVTQGQGWHAEIRRRAKEQHQELVQASRQRDADAVISIMSGHAALPIEMTDPEGA
jgi:DNA-binding GntR family transcriptional regulator